MSLELEVIYVPWTFERPISWPVGWDELPWRKLPEAEKIEKKFAELKEMFPILVVQRRMFTFLRWAGIHGKVKIEMHTPTKLGIFRRADFLNCRSAFAVRIIRNMPAIKLSFDIDFAESQTEEVTERIRACVEVLNKKARRRHKGSVITRKEVPDLEYFISQLELRKEISEKNVMKAQAQLDEILHELDTASARLKVIQQK